MLLFLFSSYCVVYIFIATIKFSFRMEVLCTFCTQIYKIRDNLRFYPERGYLWDTNKADVWQEVGLKHGLHSWLEWENCLNCLLKLSKKAICCWGLIMLSPRIVPSYLSLDNLGLYWNYIDISGLGYHFSLQRLVGVLA